MDRSSDLLSSLPVDTQNEVIKYMKFFKDKREITLSALDGDFADTLEDRLRSISPPYSLQDVTEALDHLQICVKDGVRQDLSRMLGMNVLMLKNLLETSQERGVQLHVDTSIIENEALIQEAEKIRLDAPARAEPKDMQRSKLKSLKDEQKELVNEKNLLAGQNETLQQRFATMQAQAAQYLKEKNSTQAELDAFRRRLESQSESSAAQAKRSQDDAKDASEASDMGRSQLEVLQRNLADTKRRLVEAEEELEAKLTSSGQFKEMKRLMTDKTRQVKDLRTRLARYEPDALEDDDRVRA